MSDSKVDESWLATAAPDTSNANHFPPQKEQNKDRISLQMQPMNTDESNRGRKRALGDDTTKPLAMKRIRKQKGPLNTADSMKLLDEHFLKRPDDLMKCDEEDFKSRDPSSCVFHVGEIIKSWRNSDVLRRPIVIEEVTKKVMEDVTKKVGNDFVKTVMENRSLPVTDYFENLQTDLKPRMRTILFSWLIEVHLKFKLRETSLWQAFQLVDIFLSVTRVHRNRLQLVGSCCLWITSKYHDIYPPLAKDFVYISDKAFTRNDLLTCEELICKKMAFNLTTPTIYNLLQRYIKVAAQIINVERRKTRVKWLSMYTAERCVLAYESLLYRPDWFASGVVCAALSMTGTAWTPEMEAYTGFTGNELKAFCRLARKTVLKFEDPRHKAVIKKYSATCRGAVAKLRKK